MQKKTVKIIFVRHGESESNVLKVHTDSRDKFPLTQKGRREVEKIADKLQDENVDVIIVSPVLRTRETASTINKKVKSKIIIDEAVSEYDWGKWMNIPIINELYEKFPEYAEYKKLSQEERFEYRLGENGESRKEVVERIRKFIRELVANYLGKTVLLVSHGGINGAIYKVLTDCSIDDFFKQEEIDHNVIQYFVVDKDFKLVDFKSKKV
jgi:broad specificity phosphatase PhoE